MHIHKKDFFTVPNILTYIRFLLVPVFCVLYLKYPVWPKSLWSLGAVALSAITDVFDGIIARKTGQVTDLGKILDPIADKAIEFAMMLCVVIRYPLVWTLVVIFGVKEIVSLAFSTCLLAKGKHISGALWFGKLCTVVLYAAMIVFIVLPKVPHNVVVIIVVISAVFMLLAFALYMSAYIKLFLEYKKELRDQNSPEL